jgi:hypothetical protein
MLCRGVRDQRDWSGGACRGKEDKESAVFVVGKYATELGPQAGPAPTAHTCGWLTGSAGRPRRGPRVNRLAPTQLAHMCRHRRPPAHSC